MKVNKKCKCGCEIVFEVDKTYKLPKTKECIKCGNKVVITDEKEEEKSNDRSVESSLPENNTE